MPPRDLSRIPSLERNALIVALQKLERVAELSPAAKRELRNMLLSASNPDVNKIETIIKTLPKARQEEIWRIFDELAAQAQAQADAARNAVLLLGVLSLGSLIISYLLNVDQQAIVTAQLFEVNKRTWINAIQGEIDYCGCNARARGASGSDLEVLRQMAIDDAQSITQTWNKDSQRELEKVFKDFPNGDKQFYISHMQTWAAKRATWKMLQIAATTEFNAREFAKRRFAEMNYPTTALWRFTGPAAICKRCMRQFAAGHVSFEHTRAFATPIHPLCPHSWSLVRKPKIDCASLWTG